VTAVVDADTFTLGTSGLITGLSGLTAGQVYYLSGTAGAITATEPTAVSSVSKPVFTATSTTSGYLNNFRGSPAQGQTAVVEYVTANLTADVTGITAVGDVVFNSVTSGNIPLNTSTGEFTLTAGNTYQLEANLAVENSAGTITTAASIIWQWVDSTNTALVASKGKGRATASSVVGNNTNDGGTTNAVLIYTPSVTQTVKVRMIDVNLGGATSLQVASGVTAGEASSYVSIVQIGASPVPMDLAGEYGENTSITHNGTLALTGTTVVDVPGSSFTLPSAGVWEVDYSLFTTTSVATQNYGFFIRDSSNNIVANSSSEYYNALGSSGTNLNISVGNKVFITTSGSATYKLSGIGGGGVFTVTVYNAVASNSQLSGNSKITYRKISGFLPSSGQTVDYGSYTKTSQSITAVADLTGWTAVSGNIATDGTSFTLSAGKTYEISAVIDFDNFNVAADSITIGLVDSSNVGIPGSTSAILDMTAGPLLDRIKASVNAVYTPSSATTVKLRVTANAGTNIVAANTSLIIKQLGTSSALTEQTAAMVFAQNTSAQSIPNTGTDTTITGWTEVQDTTGSFNASTGVFTAPRTGNYAISASFASSSSTWAAGDFWRTGYSVNGTTQTRTANTAWAGVTTVIAASHTSTFRLTAGDTLSPFVSSTRTGGATTLNAAGFTNVFSIVEVPSTV